MGQFTFDFAPARRVYSVSELNGAIRGALEREFPDLWVAGEISGVKLAASGHYYFTLKERDAQVRAVAFRSAHRYWKFKPQDGLAVLARGRIDVFEARGEYQLIVELLEPQGYGALQLAFEELKKKLAAEGLFDAARKRPLPRYPRRIGIVTSPRGAVIADMVQILSRRFPGVHVRLYPALVQGEGSIDEICRGVDYFSRGGWAEVVIVARGGGSLEDLWSFNEESVARVIARSAVPVVSAVGHETDITIADFVADLRAPTPSAAAEMIVPIRQEVIERIQGTRQKLAAAARFRLAMLGRSWRQQGIERPLALLHRNIGRHAQRVDELEFRLRDLLRVRFDRDARRQRALARRLSDFDLRPRLAGDRRRLEAARVSAAQSIRLALTHSRGPLERHAAKLSQLNPLRILDRGYAIVTDESGAIVKESAAVPAGAIINVRLARGRLEAQVTKAAHEPFRKLAEPREDG